MRGTRYYYGICTSIYIYIYNHDTAEAGGMDSLPPLYIRTAPARICTLLIVSRSLRPLANDTWALKSANFLHSMHLNNQRSTLTSIPSMDTRKPCLFISLKNSVCSSFFSARENTQTSLRRETSCWYFESSVLSLQRPENSCCRKAWSSRIITTISYLLKSTMELRADIMFSSNKEGVGRITSWMY